MAATIGGAILAERSSSSYLCFSKPLFSSSSSTAKAPSFYGFVRSIGSKSLVSHSVRFAAPAAIRFNQIRCFSKRPPIDINSVISKFRSRIPGWDQEHWHIIMEKPGDEDVTKQEMIDCYIQTLAKVLGSEEEAKKKIYKVCSEEVFGFGFGCEVDKEMAKKLEGLPGVVFVVADSYVDVEYKDYGGEVFVDGEIVKRSPERQERMDAYMEWCKKRNLETSTDEDEDPEPNPLLYSHYRGMTEPVRGRRGESENGQYLDVMLVSFVCLIGIMVYSLSIRK